MCHLYDEGPVPFAALTDEAIHRSAGPAICSVPSPWGPAGDHLISKSGVSLAL